MRRKDREIRDLDQLEDILKECDAVRIAAQDEAGLFIVPMNFGYRLEGEAWWPLRWTAATPCVLPTLPAATVLATGALWAPA